MASTTSRQANPTFFSSTIGRKYLMALTGLGLSVFVLLHMLGNLGLFVSAEVYNKYSHALISNPLIYVAEIGLLAIFIIHIISAVLLSLRNQTARLDRYAMPTHGQKAVTNASKTMIHTGIVILIFTVYHLITFKYGPHYEVTYNGVTMRDLHQLVLEVFKSPAYVAGYVFALLLLGHHLSHGVQSAIKTLGFYHPKYVNCVGRIGLGFALLVTIGFVAQPLYVFFSLNR